MVYFRVQSKPLIGGCCVQFGLKVSVSFLVALSLLSLIISVLFSLEIKGKNAQYDSFLWYVYLFLFCVVVLVISFFKDVYWVFVILLYQVGVVLQNWANYTVDNKFSLVFTSITAFVFVFSLFYVALCGSEDKELKQLEKHRNENDDIN